MADTQSNIQVSIDTTQALASIKNLQRQISAFHSSMAKGGAAANAVSTQLQQTLINSVNATGQFSAGIRTIRTTTESFTSSLEKNKFSLGEYFRYAGGATKTFGRLFKTEHDTINKVARENVKDLQTQYIRLGRDASGAMKAIAVRPLSLDMSDLATRTQIAAQKQAIFNQLLKQGSTNLLNFGKNTQWAGRQLMVGFTLPLIAVGSAAAKTFMDMETQAIRFKKVYGDLFTPNAESQQALKDIQELGKEFTKYGIAVSTTVGLAAEAAAAGFKGVDLTRQTTAATRLSILGQVESQKALETTISLQNAFSMSSENLAESIDFLNAVENQTVLSLDDISTAIPKAAPIVQQLGGDVKDLAFLMTAMKEGGINASEGANALKSGLASLINPTGKANDMLLSFGINAKKIVVDNKGDLKKTVVEFATALNMLDPLNRAQAIEQMFGKFQFSRLSTLFANVTKEGTQASRVLDLAGASVQELASLSEKELGMTSESAMNKFKGAIENLKLSLIPLGEEFLKAVTPIAEFITRILEKFDGLSSGTKKFIVTITGVIAGLGPVLLMTVGLVMNGLANMIKLFAFLKSAFNKTGRSTETLGTEVKYMTTEQRNAAAVAASLDQVHTKLSQTFTSEASAVNALTRAYQRAVAAQSQFVPVGPPITRGPIKKFAGGRPATVGGTGNKDSELALLMPGETVIPTAMSQKYGSIINAMISDNVPGYEIGKPEKGATTVPIYPENAIRLQPAAENMAGRASTTTVPQVLSPLALRIGEARGIAPTLSKVESGVFDSIYREYEKITTDFVKRVNLEYNTTFKDIKDENERMRKAWSAAGKAVGKQVDSIASPKDRAVVRKAFGLVDDDYGTIPTDSREAGGTAPNRSRRGAFKSRLTGLRSYTRIRPGAKRLYERMTGKSAADLQMGHVFPPRTVDLATLEADPRKSGSVATARAVTERGRQDAEAYEAGKKKGKIKDPYVTSTESTRKSPHPQAAKDGTADARAYAAARDKELRKQSGRARRVAIRPQGPAPIGATPQPGMTVLPIVPGGSGTPPDPNTKPKTRLAGMAGKMTGMGGGMGLLGANMGLSMLPDFAGKDMLQGTMTGANLGMMFGPYGMAAGAAIGLVTSALSNLIEKQKQHKAMTEAMFKSSASVAQFFGNAVVDTTMQVGRLNSAIIYTSGSTENLGKTFGYTNEELQRFSDLVASLPKGDPLKDVLTGLEDENNPEEIKRIIDNFVTTQVAVGQTLPEQAQKIYDLILAQSGNQSMVGQSFYNFKTQSEAVSATLKNANKNSVDLGNSLTQLIGAASNSSSLVQIQSIIDGIAASGLGAAQGLNAMYYAYLRIGNQGAADSLLNLQRIKGLTQAEIADLMVFGTKGFRYEVGKDTTRKQILEALAEFKKTAKEEEESLSSGTNSYQDLDKEKTGSIKKEIDLLKKRKKIIDDQIKKEKQITDELKKQNDYRDKQLKIDKEIVEAKIRGDYIQAAILLQEKANNTEEFNKDKQISDLQKRSDALQEQIDERQSVSDAMVAAVQATTSAVVTGSANIVEAVLQGGFPSKDGQGTFKDPQVIVADESSRKSYIESKKPSAGMTNEGVSAGTVTVSQIDPVKAWNESFLEKAASALSPNLKTEMDILEDYIRSYARFAPDQTHIFVELKGSDGLTYKFKLAKKTGKDDFVRVGEPIKKASGGMIRGAGTGTSDSIPAYLSNGEYVVKAKSVKKYGVSALDALNAGRFAEGGLINTNKSKMPNIPLSAGSTATMFSPPTGLANDPKFRDDKKEADSFLPLLGAAFGTLLKPFTPSEAPDKNKQSEWSKKVRAFANKLKPYQEYMSPGGKLTSWLFEPLRQSATNLYAGDAKWNDYTNILSSLAGTGAIKSGVSGIATGIGRFGSSVGKVGSSVGKMGIKAGSGIKSGTVGAFKFLSSIPARIKELRVPSAYEHFTFKSGYESGRKSGTTNTGLGLDKKVIAAKKAHDAPLIKILDEAGYEPDPNKIGSWVEKGTDTKYYNPDRYIEEGHPLMDIVRKLNNPMPAFNPYLHVRDKYHYGTVIGAKVKSIKDGFSNFLASKAVQESSITSRLMSNRFFGIKFTDYMARKSRRALEPFKMGLPLSSIEEALATTNFHGGNLSNITNRVVNSGPVKEGGKFFKGMAINPAKNWFGMDTFATSSKDVARNYLDKNGPLSSIFELAIRARTANPLDIRHGTPPLSISNPKFLRAYIKALLKSGKTRDAFDFLIQEGGTVARRGINASEARAQEFSQSTETIEALIKSGFNSILHTGGMNLTTNPEKILHTVLGMIDPKNLITNARSIGKAQGGMIRGAGTPTSDSIPAYLSNGEYVVKADSVKKYGVGTLHAINAGKFAEGGLIKNKKDVGSLPGKFLGDRLKIKNRRYKDNMGGNTYIPNSLVVPNIRDIYETMNLANGGLIPGYAGGGIVGNILGGIGKLISKLFVGKQAGKPIKPNEVEKFLSDTLGDVPLPKIKKEELPAGVGGQYIPRFSDKSSNYENLLPHILFNSKYKVQGNTAIHETMHHFDMDVMHDSFRRTIAKLRKDGKTDLADEYESLFVTAENKQKGMGLAVWEDRAITLQDYDSLTYFGGAAEAFADESTFKAYTKFMSSKKIKDKKLALKIGDPYGPGYGDLRGYFSSYAQFENNALNMPMRLNPSFLRGLVENSPNMPQATKDVYLGWAEGLQRFKPPARTNPDEIKNSLQWQNFKKYITDNGLDKAKGFHDGGPVGHKHPSTSYSPALMSASDKEIMALRAKLIKSRYINSQYLPRLVEPTPGVSPFNIPVSASSTASLFSPATGIAGDPKFIADSQEATSFSRQLGDMFNFAMTPLTPSKAPDVNKQTEKSKYMREQMAIAWDMMHKVNPAFKLGSWLVKPMFDAATNIGAGDGKWNDYTSIAAMFAGTGLYKGAATAGGTGIKSLAGAVKGSAAAPVPKTPLIGFKTNRALRKRIAELRKEFVDIKAEGKIRTPEGNEIRLELAQYEALLASRLNNFTPLMYLKNANTEKLIAENNALPSLIKEPFELNGQEFVFRFDRSNLTDYDTQNIQYFLDDLQKGGNGQLNATSGEHIVQLIDPSTKIIASYIRYDPITGHIRSRGTHPSYQQQGLSAALYNKAASMTRIRHSPMLTTDGSATAPLIGGFMADDNIFHHPRFIKPTKPKKPKKPKQPEKQPLTTSDSLPGDGALQDSWLAGWRMNPHRTYNSYPGFQGSGAYIDPEDLFDMQRLMHTPDEMAGFPWARSAAAAAAAAAGLPYPSIATGGYLDKGKIRIPKFANGGLIRGPGTGISDSITASLGYAGGGSIRVSNGEYVVKASSVRDYGVKTMDAINNGTAAVGANSGGTVYNINMPVTSNNANPEIVANEVMRKLKLEVSKNNKSNKVGP
jgi:TP901 family phage tail tape measure protein